jgi:hypothetical protein
MITKKGEAKPSEKWPDGEACQSCAEINNAPPCYGKDRCPFMGG